MGYVIIRNAHIVTSVSQFSHSVMSNSLQPMDCSMPGFFVHHQLPELTQTHVHGVSDAIQPSHPLSSPLLLPSIFPSIRVFSNQSVLCIRWPRYWSFSFSISPSNEYSGLISYRIHWFDVLAVQGTARRSNQSTLKEISPGISMEGMMLKLKLQYFGHLM